MTMLFVKEGQDAAKYSPFDWLASNFWLDATNKESSVSLHVRSLGCYGGAVTERKVPIDTKHYSK